MATRIKKTKIATHGIVFAKAGTGKTFTLILGIAWMFRKHVWSKSTEQLGFEPKPSEAQSKIWSWLETEKPSNIVYCAFNTTIVKEFDNKWKWLCLLLQSIGVFFSFSTINSLGHRLCTKQYPLKGWGCVNRFRYRNMISKILGKDYKELERDKKIAPMLEAAGNMYNLVRQSLAHYENQDGTLSVDDDKFYELASKHEVELDGQDEEILSLVNKLLNEGRNVTTEIDFIDQIWLPIVNNLPMNKIDLMLVDEGQDLNPCQQELVLRMGNRILLVGDENQAIYGFAGADTDSIPNMFKKLERTQRGCQKFPLNMTYRCGKKIVEKARTIVPDFEAHPNNIDGQIIETNYGTMKKTIKDEELVLCRINAPLVSLAFSLIKIGRKATIQGRNIGQGLISLITKIMGKETDVDTLLDRIEIYYQKEAERMSKRRNFDENMLVTLQDKVECIRLFSENAFTLEDVKKRITEVFDLKNFDDKKPKGVWLSSIHKAKGLECHTVYILNPELLPHPMAKQSWAKIQEKNLEYVAITRAINTLCYVRSEGELIE